MMILVLVPGSLDLMRSTSMKPSFAVLLGHQVSFLPLASYIPNRKKQEVSGFMKCPTVVLFEF